MHDARIGGPERRRRASDDSIAVVGIGCTLPGGIVGPEEYWRFLCEGRSGIVTVPAGRWDLRFTYDPNPDAVGKSVTKWGGFIDGIFDFDAEFFGISPREASAMDPQQKILLHCAWEALEDAGLPADRIAGSHVGVFVGVSMNENMVLRRLGHLADGVHTGTGSALSIVANRVSHRLDLRGASVVVDTACSSSLVAVDLACQSLLRGEGDTALACGVNAILDPASTVMFSKANMMSPTGRCHSFDARANGYVRSEGVGVVVLRRLRRALEDGDRIYAVLRATASNQNGRTSTITVPSAAAQSALLRTALDRAGMEPGEIEFVEAHGTGTPVGDPIEAHAIGEVFGRSRRDGKRVAVGAGKSAIGHLESASGVAGLIKAALCVERGAIPPNLNFRTINPNIPADALGLRFPQALEKWDAGHRRRAAAVNSFGFGGSNACAIIEQAPDRAAESARGDLRGALRGKWCLPISAASPEALQAKAETLAEIAATVPLHEIASTLALGRARLPHRMTAIAGTAQELLEALRPGPAKGAKAPEPKAFSGIAQTDRRPVFVFAGQGGQAPQMGLALLRGDEAFRQAVEEFDRVYRARSGLSPIEEMARPEGSSRIDATIVSQPCTFAIQYGLLARWRQWGIVPAAVIGHSFGEIAAAHAAGAHGLDETALLVHRRAELSSRSAGLGAVYAVGLTGHKLEEFLREIGETGLDIAAYNGASLVNLAGPTDALEKAVAALERRHPGTFLRRIRMDYAPHCRLLDPVKSELMTDLVRLAPRPTAIPMISTATGRIVEGPALTADYWWRAIRQPVLFTEALDAALAQGFRIFLEIGPQGAMSALVGAYGQDRGKAVAAIPSLARDRDDGDAIEAALARLTVAGVEPDWQTLGARPHARARLPGHPWRKTRLVEDSPEIRHELFPESNHPLLGIPGIGPVRRWRNGLNAKSARYIADHNVFGAVLLPGACFLEMLLAAGRQIHPNQAFELLDVAYVEALTLTNDRVEAIETVYEPERGRLSVYSREMAAEVPWTLRATALVRPIDGPAPPPPRNAAVARRQPWRKGAEVYEIADAVGFKYGPTLRGIAAFRASATEIEAKLRVAGDVRSRLGEFLCHPALVDVSTHGFFAAERYGFVDKERLGSGLLLPTAIRRVRWFGAPSGAMRSILSNPVADGDRTRFDVTLCKADGTPLLALEAYTLQRVANVRLRMLASGTNLCSIAVHWDEKALEAAAAAPADPGVWLVFEGGRADARIAAALRRKGLRCIAARPGDAYAAAGDRATVRPDRAEDYRRAIEHAAATGPLAGVVHAWSRDDVPPDTSPMARQGQGVRSVMLLAQELAARPAPARLWIVTRDAQILPIDRPEADPAHAAIVGFARTLNGEAPDLRTTVIDADDRAWPGVLEEIARDGAELEVAWRGRRRFVPRAAQIQTEDAKPLPILLAEKMRTSPFRIGMSAPGVLENLTAFDCAAEEPGPGQVAIAVAAVGLNFRDVMAATGLLPADAEFGAAWDALGLECAGTVTEVGRGVSHVRPGDRVVATGRGVLRSHALCDARRVFRLPGKIGFAEAASIPSAFLTAYHSLIGLARLQKGERVLIQAATGGVGLAAIQIAQLAGAEIFATAGSDAKRAYLKKLGIRHVLNSRSLEFAAEIRRITAGEGIDVVLNSIAGRAIEAGLSVLRPFGRFVEIGKRDIYADSSIGLRALRNNVSMHVVDLANADAAGASTASSALKSLLGRFARGTLKALPVTVFPAARSEEAFRLLAQAKHIGKVVITTDRTGLVPVKSAKQVVRPDAAGAHVVTGGYGGFGLALMDRLVERGARRLYVLSRSGPSTAEARRALSALRRRGAFVHDVRGDVGRAADVSRLAARIRSDGRRVVGVYHCAMVLDDCFVRQLDAARLERVLEPKAGGAWNLHRAFLDEPVEHFVMISSVAALFGAPGQANYAAANAYLDALALARRARGLNGASLALGPLADAGVVHRNKALARYLKSAGTPAMPIAHALAGLDTLFVKDLPHLAILLADWPAMARANAKMAANPRLGGLIASQGGDGAGQARADIMNAPAPRRAAMLAQYLQERVAKTLRMPAEKLDRDRPLAEFGLDSLTAFELKNTIEGDLGISLNVNSFLQKPTVNGLADAVSKHIEQTAGAKADAPAAAAESAKAAALTESALTPNQLRYWRTYPRWRALSHRGRAPFAIANVSLAFSCQPRLDIASLERAFAALVQRHEALRTSFPEAADGLPTAKISAGHPTGLEIYEVGDLAEADFLALLRRRAEDQLDERAGPPIRLQLYRRPDETDVLLIQIDHLVVDGWAVALVLRDLLMSYFGMPLPDDPPVQPLSAFVEFQRAFVQSPEGQREAAYWRKRLTVVNPPLVLPQDRPRQSEYVQSVGSIKSKLDRETARRVGALAQKLGVTPFAVLMASFKLLLWRLSGEPEFNVLSAASNRVEPRFRNLVGFINNNLTLRTRIDPMAPFGAFAAAVFATIQDGLAHQRYPFTLIMEELAASHDVVRTYAERVALSSDIGQFYFGERRPNMGDDLGIGDLVFSTAAEIRFGSSVVKGIDLQRVGAWGDITAFADLSEDGYLLQFNYNADIFDRETARSFVVQYVALVQRAVERPGDAVLDLAEAAGAAAATAKAAQ